MQARKPRKLDNFDKLDNVILVLLGSGVVWCGQSAAGADSERTTGYALTLNYSYISGSNLIFALDGLPRVWCCVV